MKKISGLLVFFLMFAFIFFLPFMSASVKGSVTVALDICLSELVPSLFPFLFFASLFSYYGANLISAIFSPVLCPLFKISKNACPAVIAGILGGFPAGAVMAAELYREKKISASEAERLPVFCNNAGIMFAMGTLGVGHFSSFKAGLLIYFFHIFASVIAGLLSGAGRERVLVSSPSDNVIPSPDIIAPLFTKALTKSIYSMALICGNFIIFNVISGVLSPLFKDSTAKSFIFGLAEVTGGVLSMPETNSGIILSVFLLSFNGLCVHMQTLSCFAPLHLSIKKYILGKIFCAFLSSFLAYISLPGNVTDSQNFPAMAFYIIMIVIPALFLIPGIKRKVSGKA